MKYNFDDIRPCNKSEANALINRLTSDPRVLPSIKWLYPDRNPDEVIAEINKIKVLLSFQSDIMGRAVRTILDRTADDFITVGYENQTSNSGFLFISNHRDIFLDSGLIQITRMENNWEPSYTAFGSNLIQGQVIADFAKLNKMFTVQREGSRRELYEHSCKLSAYIRQILTVENEAVWIAQREGRTKDGKDFTQPGVLKMFDQSGTKGFVENFSELNITPVTVSYEYEPCDLFKARETYYVKTTGKYVKQPIEDIQSITEGILSYKGRVQLSIDKPLTKEELQEIDSLHEKDNDKIKALTTLVDNKIKSNYRLWPTNYIALDLLNGDSTHKANYTLEEKVKFEKILEEKLNRLDSDKAGIRETMLEIYANPVLCCEPLQVVA